MPTKKQISMYMRLRLDAHGNHEKAVQETCEWYARKQESACRNALAELVRLHDFGYPESEPRETLMQRITEQQSYKSAAWGKARKVLRKKGILEETSDAE